MVLAERNNTRRVQGNRRQLTTQMLAIFSGHSGSCDLLSFGVAGKLTHLESFILYESRGIGPLCMVLCPPQIPSTWRQTWRGRQNRLSGQSSTDWGIGEGHRSEKWPGRLGIWQWVWDSTLPICMDRVGPLIYRILWLYAAFVRDYQGSNPVWAGAFPQYQTLHTHGLGKILRCWISCSGTYIFQLGLLACLLACLLPCLPACLLACNRFHRAHASFELTVQPHTTRKPWSSSLYLQSANMTALSSIFKMKASCQLADCASRGFCASGSKAQALHTLGSMGLLWMRWLTPFITSVSAWLWTALLRCRFVLEWFIPTSKRPLGR